MRVRLYIRGLGEFDYIYEGLIIYMRIWRFGDWNLIIYMRAWTDLEIGI